jgi:MFS transporter, putative metabolite:H+ symporter
MVENKNSRALFSLPVIVAALGYFVDIYDLLLFSVVRKASLTDLGITSAAELTSTGEFLLRVQMGGLLAGGVIWGIMGDKKGRLSVLFGSILLYSLANIANGMVTTVNQYAWLRFIAGIGLAGELGAGITLVSETLPKQLRGYGTTLVATVGLMGAVVAYFVSEWQDWRTCYYIGGGLGIILLITRVSVFESGIFLEAKNKDVERGNFFQLFTSSVRFKKFIGCVFIGLPIWFVIGILITFSPEFAKALKIEGEVVAGAAVMVSYLGLAVGDLTSGIASQLIKSRKKIVAAYITLTLFCVALYLFNPVHTVTFFYVTCFILGVGIGYWALFVTIAAEQFGTNLRATVATSVPNFIRGTVIPLTLIYAFLRDRIGGPDGVIFAALIVAVFTVIIAYISLFAIDETFGRDLNYEETDQ